MARNGVPQAPPRIQSEVAALHRRYDSVRYEAAARTVVVEGVAPGSGWTPRTVPVRLRVPAGYPHAAPRLVLPGTLRYRGRVPRTLLVSGQFLVRGQLGNPIYFWPQWEQSHTLVDAVDQLLAELAAAADAEPVSRGGDP